MGAKYASGLFDANDLAAAYNEGYHDAFQKVVLEVKVRCPWCSNCLAVTTHPLLNLPTVIHTTWRWCAQCDTFVRSQIQMSAAS